MAEKISIPSKTRSTAGIVLLLMVISITDNWGLAEGRSQDPGLRQMVVPGKAIVSIKLPVSEGDSPTLRKQAGLTAEAVFARVSQKVGVTTYKPLFNPAQLALLKGGTRLSRYFIIDFEDIGKSYKYVSASLASQPEVVSVEPVLRLPILIDPDDSFYGNQSHLPQISAPQAWDYTTGDSSIIIAVVDNGFDMEHEDLQANYAVNQVEALGITGVDDDGNGLIDDISGYDFYDDDPDPSFGASQMSGYRHGTHVAGIAAAVGNNGIGTVGVSWNCRILPIKASSDDEPKFVSSAKGLQGIVYAAAQGAVVVNLSWGSEGSYSQAAQDVMRVAKQNGTIVVASGGNEGNDVTFYPSGYHRVLSVAWVDGMDIKATGASYGKTIDLAAPGSGIFSTMPDDNYGQISGSSMSAPMVAGAVALVKGIHPEWTYDQIVQQVAFSADLIDNLNPLYTNGLGSGRLNLEQALVASELQEPLVKILLRKYSFSDSLLGNGNSIAEGGETITLSTIFDNGSLGSSPSVHFQLSALDDTLGQMDVSSLMVPALPDTELVPPGEFSFTISESFRTGVARFLLTYAGTNVLAGQDTMILQVGRAPILIVDDDDGINNVDGFYTNLLEAMDLPYFHWDHTLFGSPRIETLQQFPMVVWLCEWEFPSLNANDREAISAYLEEGGNLFITGQDIGWDLSHENSQNASDESRDFYADYLKAQFVLDDANAQSVFGTESDVLGNGINFDIYQPGRIEAFQFPDVFVPADSAHAVFNYAGDKGVGALRYNQSYGLVYFGFGLEAINASINSEPASTDPVRTQVFTRVLNYLHPLKFTKLEDRFTPVSSVPVNVDYSGPGMLPEQVVMYYSLPNSSIFDELEMVRNGASYSVDLPTDGVSGPIRYYFESRDLNFDWPFPVGGQNHPFTVYVGADTVAPIISIDPVYNRLDLSPSYEVRATLFENTMLDTTNLYLRFSYGQAPNDSALMVFDQEAGKFTGYISGEFSFGDSIRYWITASDRAVPANTSSSEIGQFVIGVEDFESGLGQWDWDSVTWGLDSTTFFSGQFGLSTFPDQAYYDNVNGSISTKLPLDFSQADQLQLMFRSRYEIETGDMGLVELRIGEGSWQIVAGPFTGYVGKWTGFSVDLLPFVGQSECALRFRFVSDQETSTPLFGWFIDDIRILQDGFVTGVFSEKEVEIPRTYLWPSYPNPVRERTEITLDLAEPAEIRIRLFNLLGQIVREIYFGPANRGRARWTWDGRDDFGEKLPSGVYFLQVIADNFKSMQKLIIIR